ncbi:helix-turn-helix transcriptional regulator [Persicobacter psychrovividus]|uniref:HTH cro/C1-type domain-containing protein n=1 Tax=Persicobacter psychrovividus TaxID=387638 RepID=A0ABM7VN15_9BACT|nr:hypothetical protein PEPS_46850 [Persicobacter psychrovividus]
MERLKEHGAVTFSELKDQQYGKRGEAERETYELETTVFLLGTLIKNERKKQKMTKAQLGEKLGVKKARVAEIEKGEDVSISLFLNAMKALDLSAKIVVDGELEVPLT